MWESDVALNISWISTIHTVLCLIMNMVVGERQNVWQWQADALTVYCDRDGTAQMDGSMNDKL